MTFCSLPVNVFINYLVSLEFLQGLSMHLMAYAMITKMEYNITLINAHDYKDTGMFG
jgi:hypothetical protein